MLSSSYEIKVYYINLWRYEVQSQVINPKARHGPSLLPPGNSREILADLGCVSSEPESSTPVKVKMWRLTPPSCPPFSVPVKCSSIYPVFLASFESLFFLFDLTSFTHGPALKGCVCILGLLWQTGLKYYPLKDLSFNRIFWKYIVIYIFFEISYLLLVYMWNYPFKEISINKR